jgi:hypothetical protein
MQLLPDIKPWAMFALFVLVFPTGNAISEREASLRWEPLIRNSDQS